MLVKNFIKRAEGEIQKKEKKKKESTRKRSREKSYRQFFRIAFEHTLQIQLLDFTLESRRQARVHGRPARQYDVLVEGRAHVDIGRLDGGEDQLGDARTFDIDQMRLEESFGSFESLAANFDNSSVR